jgi:putative acetyltransferase
MSIAIRHETMADLPAIEAVTIAAFRDAPHTTHTEQFIVRALRDAGMLELSLVAEADGVVIGHVGVSPVRIEGGTPGWFGLGPVSVRPEDHGRGIGSRLVRAALSLLRERGAAGCVVLGDPAFYSRFGFRSLPGLVLPGVPPAHFQALPFGAPVPRGIVSYHEAFDAQK